MNPTPFGEPVGPLENTTRQIASAGNGQVSIRELAAPSEIRNAASMSITSGEAEAAAGSPWGRSPSSTSISDP